MSETIAGWLAQLLAAGGGGALVAYFVFKYLGDNWIKHRLAKNLEQAKSEISLLAALKLKLHDQEYVVFPEIWSKLNAAVAALGSAVSLFKEYADLDRMREDEFQKWLGRSDLNEHEKEFLLAQERKNNAYGRILDFRALRKANEGFIEFHTYLNDKRIFIDPVVKSKLDEIDDLLHSIWVDRKISLEDFGDGDSRKYWTDAWKKYKDTVKPAMVDIEALFQKKLFPLFESKQKV